MKKDLYMKSDSIIGIIGAMDTEVEKLLLEVENLKSESICGNDFYQGKIGKVSVVISRSGIGKVNAARCAQIMIDRYRVSSIINSGIAGGIAPGLKIGDICIGEYLIQHDYDLTPFGYVRGHIPKEGDREKPTRFRADEGLVNIFEEVSAGISTDNSVYRGTIVSGDQFIAETAKKEELYQEFNACAAEMEGAAIAQCAAYAGIPFVVIRVISDLANGDGPSSFEEFEEQAADMSIAITNSALKLL